MAAHALKPYVHAMIDHLANAARIAALVPVLLLGNCPVTAEAPIADATTDAFDRRLPGTWRCMSGDDDSVETLRLESRQPSTLMLLYEDNQKPDSSALHSARLGGVRVANMRLEFGGGGEGWAVARLRMIDTNVFRLGLLSADVPDSLREKDRRKALEKAAKAGSFGDELVCLRR
jgi:hypothetical protein